MCKRSDTFSLAVLIGRGLDLLSFYFLYFVIQFLGCESVEKEVQIRNAPLAQLVEHLTLNQGVPGSSP